MAPARSSVARLVVIVGMCVQIAGLARLIFLQVGALEWLHRLPHSPLAARAATLAFVGSILLIVPLIQGRRWAHLAVVPLQIGAGLGRGQNIIGGHGILGMGKRDFLCLCPQLLHRSNGFTNTPFYFGVHPLNKILFWYPDLEAFYALP